MSASASARAPSGCATLSSGVLCDQRARARGAISSIQLAGTAKFKFWPRAY
jgi:hypothetical protein